MVPYFLYFYYPDLYNIHKLVSFYKLSPEIIWTIQSMEVAESYMTEAT